MKLAATSADRVKLSGNLKEIGLQPETFDVGVTGSDITPKQPHREIFFVAAQQMHVAPDRCLVVEDALNGV
jgi:HAD superfamily hydrolase (TIGR01509 family)